jgi:aryl-alcohol dehydrogenase (NADP+)
MTYGTSKWRPWVLDEEASRPFIKRALEHGINFFDTADIYSLGVSEEVVGRALKDYAKRHEVVIATKLYNKMGEAPNDQGLSRKHIFDAIDASLRRLQVDHVDLYQIHRWDSETPIEETLEALNDVVRAGKARYIGASSMYAWQFAKSASYLRAQRLGAASSPCRIITTCLSRGGARDEPALPRPGRGPHSLEPAGARLPRRQPHAREERQHGTGRAPTTSPSRCTTSPTTSRSPDRLQEVAREHNRKPTQIALAWILSRPGMTAPIIGASKTEHLDDAVAALGSS